MTGLAARHAQVPDGLETAREILDGIRGALRRIELLAGQHSGDGRLLAAAVLRATEAAVAAEKLAARQICVEEIVAEHYARGRTDMAAAVAARRRLRTV